MYAGNTSQSVYIKLNNFQSNFYIFINQKIKNPVF